MKFKLSPRIIIRTMWGLEMAINQGGYFYIKLVEIAKAYPTITLS
jgi:hypothetical protein